MGQGLLWSELCVPVIPSVPWPRPDLPELSMVMTPNLLPDSAPNTKTVSPETQKDAVSVSITTEKVGHFTEYCVVN